MISAVARQHLRSVPVPTGLHVERFRPNLGATVKVIDLGPPIDDDSRDTLRRAVTEHGVLLFRRQKLAAGQPLALSGIFGEPLRHNPYLPSVAGHSGIESIEVSQTKNVRNDSWHADVTWVENPPRFTVLYANELPAAGGDTVWTSSTGAYDAPPPLLAQYPESLTAVNSFEANALPSTQWTASAAEIRAKHSPLDVPVIKTHPENGRKYGRSSEHRRRSRSRFRCAPGPWRVQAASLPAPARTREPPAAPPARRPPCRVRAIPPTFFSSACTQSP